MSDTNERITLSLTPNQAKALRLLAKCLSRQTAWETTRQATARVSYNQMQSALDEVARQIPEDGE